MEWTGRGAVPYTARSFVPQDDGLTSASTYKAGFPYTANHPKQVLITYVKRIKEMDAFMVSGVLKVRKRDRSTILSIE